MADETSTVSPVVTPALTWAGVILKAYVRKNPLPAADVPTVLRKIYGALRALPEVPGDGLFHSKPAVPMKKSVTGDSIVCLEDGKPMRMLKRHLRTKHGLSPDQYRIKWNLPADYPMTAPQYAKTRSALAKKGGLGRHPTRRSPHGTGGSASARLEQDPDTQNQ